MFVSLVSKEFKQRILIAVLDTGQYLLILTKTPYASEIQHRYFLNHKPRLYYLILPPKEESKINYYYYRLFLTLAGDPLFLNTYRTHKTTANSRDNNKCVQSYT